MKEKGKYLKLTIGISLIVIISVLITIWITTNMVSNMPESIESVSTKAELEDRLYDNAEIISCSDGLIVYKWNGQCYQCPGELEKNYLGTADIEVKKHKIVRVKVSKQQQVYEEQMRVLLKNGEDIFYESVYFSGDSNIYINGKKTKKKQLSISGYMKKHNKTNVVISISKGKLYYGVDKQHMKKQGYEGSFYVIKTEEGYVVVNEIGLEDYIRYVLPSEMPSYFSIEALKAQAICARTFAYVQMNNTTYAQYGANLDDTTAFQVYNSDGTTERTDEAVRKTKGKVLTCNDQLVTCYYFSTSSGMTENMEVWGGDNPAYVKKVKSEDSISPYYSWCAELDLKKYLDPQLGKLKKIKINKTSNSGYVLKLTATFENTTITYTNENEIRKFLGKYMKKITLQDGSIRTNLSLIPSASFKISKKGGKYKLKGGGYGHDIGLSQYGAQMLAENGMKYSKILKYYYKNVKIVTHNF